MRNHRHFFSVFSFALTVVATLGAVPQAEASGPHWVAGSVYFDPAALGQPVVWAGGQVKYYLDQGALSSFVSNSQAATLVAGAAQVWSSVPTSAVSIGYGGQLSEDVNGSNTSAIQPAGSGAVFPADVQPTEVGKPVAIVFDADGSVIENMYGTGASNPGTCTQDGVFVMVDGFAAAGNIQHAVIVINGRCATSTAMDGLLQYQLVRAFGRVLGLDWSQVNESMWAHDTETTQGLTGWPIMHSLERLCTGSVTTCLPNQTTLRTDDIAGLNQLYPVTPANVGSWPGKTLTAASTFTVQGTVSFRGGQGMQGVNVELTPLSGGAPDIRYTASAVSGAYYRRDGGDPVTGPADVHGNLYGEFGSDDAAKEGYFVLTGVPLPPGATSSAYQLSIEPIDPLYTLDNSVGPYDVSQVTPSGTMQTVQLGTLSAGRTVTQNFVLTDSADGAATDDGTETQPSAAGGSGEWLGKLTGYAHTGWFQFPVRANRIFTVEAQPIDENGNATENKAAIVIGFWNGPDAAGSPPDVSTTAPFNGGVVGLTTLQARSQKASEVRVAFSDLRGDGRPDYSYRARILYADSVFPARLTLNGGAFAIQGEGFRTGDTVTLNGVPAAVTSVSPTLITAVAAPVSAPTGTVVLTVRDPWTYSEAQILDGLSYDAHGTDAVKILSAPSGTVSEGVPVPMTVQVVSGDGQTPAANVEVSFAVVMGAAGLGCGSPVCQVMTNGDGVAGIVLTPETAAATQVQASLATGASILAEFDGGETPQITATNTLYIAGGAQVNWQPVALVLSAGQPVQAAAVQWSSGAGVQVGTAASTSNAAGLASTSVMAGPLDEGATATVTACESQSSACAGFSVYASHAEQAGLLPVSGVNQSLAASGTPLPVTLLVIDGGGHPLAGATVNVYQQMDAWEPPCPAAGRCPSAPELGSASATLLSDANGLVTFSPMNGGGEPVVVHVQATTGDQGLLNFTVVQTQ
jgi:hypothetical protein